MATPLEFAIHIQSKAFLRGLTRNEAFDFPKMIAGDIHEMRIRFVKDAPSGLPGSLVAVPLAGLSVQVQVGDHGAAPLTSVTMSYVADAANGDYLGGNLPLNVAAIGDLFATATEVSKLFDVEVTQGGTIQTFRRSVTIADEQDTAAYVDPEPPAVAISQAEAANLFLAKAGVNAMLWIDQGTGETYAEYVLNGVKKFDLVS